MSESPQDLRRRYRRNRRLLSAEEQSAHGEQVARAAVNSGTLLTASTCAVYLSFHADGELDTLPLISRLWSMSKTVACPVIGPDSQMDFYLITPTTRLISNRYGILEPSTRGPRSARYLNPLSLSVIFMPLVTFDDRGTRIGMGAGYYDRYIGRLSHTLRPLLIGLAHEVQRETELLPRHPWDVPLDGVLTETGWQGFNPRAKVSRARGIGV